MIGKETEEKERDGGKEEGRIVRRRQRYRRRVRRGSSTRNSRKYTPSTVPGRWTSSLLIYPLWLSLYSLKS